VEEMLASAKNIVRKRERKKKRNKREQEDLGFDKKRVTL
jgi:hypothetical protein